MPHQELETKVTEVIVPVNLHTRMRTRAFGSQESNENLVTYILVAKNTWISIFRFLTLIVASYQRYFLPAVQISRKVTVNI